MRERYWLDYIFGSPAVAAFDGRPEVRTVYARCHREDPPKSAGMPTYPGWTN